MYTSFEELGREKFADDANKHDENRENPEIKPFTTKVPSYVIESLDLVSSRMGISRNTLVQTLIGQFLGQSFFEFSIGYNGPYISSENNSEAAISKSELDKLLSDPDISDDAREFLTCALNNFIINAGVQ